MNALKLQPRRGAGWIERNFEVLKKSLPPEQAGHRKGVGESRLYVQSMFPNIKNDGVNPDILVAAYSLPTISCAGLDVVNADGLGDIFWKHALICTRIYHRLKDARRRAAPPTNSKPG